MFIAMVISLVLLFIVVMFHITGALGSSSLLLPSCIIISISLHITIILMITPKSTLLHYYISTSLHLQ